MIAEGVVALPENVLYNLIYALFFGFTEFLGVDATAHQRLFELLTAQKQTDALLAFAMHFGSLAALLAGCWGKLRRILRERHYTIRSRRLKRPPDPMAQLDLKLLRTAMLPLVLSLLLLRKSSRLITGFSSLALFLLINGLVLFIPRLLNSGNKDGRSVSRLDSIVIGLGGCFGVVPGISRIGCLLTAGAVSGLDRSYALDIAFLLSVPVMIGLLVLDVIAVITTSISITFITVMVYLLYAIASFIGGWLAMVMMRYLAMKIGFTHFAYYSLGLALFAFIFYLVI